ncbi:ornithine cyclodeaminase family protein [Asticcacaulis machinosus]|uniref:Ornithine cyclodeaminase family protein n=1 Tax=Asticcacaulis machinosus TaxID=2984211 RepID=A0ABT5HN92_9CAUL|nr:ornithine cyclodeaminase family protein [Asticcacaulis machinosus]MDC7677720.1 ornithine cyclodeaminase family protein [Asticcacaulis machinosus]
MTYTHYDPAAVIKWLDYPGCIAAVRQAMAAFSASEAPQPLRTIIPLAPLKVLALMPGFLMDEAAADKLGIYGGKIISVVRNPENTGRSKHHGLVIVFDPKTGELVCSADAGEVTEIRTACASAVATDALARKDAKRLTIFGAGAQAKSHVEAIRHVRALEDIRIWARDYDKAATFAADMALSTGLRVYAVADAPDACKGADIICTTTGSSEPVLFRDWVEDGTHLNIVGSSGPGPVEVDNDLVVASRYIADSRRSVLAAGAEFLVAKEAGLITDDHIVAEIGEVLNDTVVGRRNDTEITFYKSLGHVVQDLCSAAYIHAKATA